MAKVLAQEWTSRALSFNRYLELGGYAMLGLGVGSEVPPVYRATGCSHCDYQGYKGRLSLLELLKFDQFSSNLRHVKRIPMAGSTTMVSELRYFNALCVFSEQGQLTLCDLNGIKQVKKYVGLIGKTGDNDEAQNSTFQIEERQ